MASPVTPLYGAVTSGKLWQVLMLEGQRVTLDSDEYAVPPVEKILGTLVAMVSGS
jgi:hypothetical protein